MTKKEAHKKILAFQNAGLLDGFNDKQIDALVGIYQAEEKLMLSSFTNDEKFIFRIRDFKKNMPL